MEPEGTGERMRRLDLDCGIARARIEAWLDDGLRAVRSKDRWVVEAGGSSCSVLLVQLEPRTLGGLELERVRLVVEGTARGVDELERLFTLRFLGAGG